jgi:hypothetical protein
MKPEICFLPSRLPRFFEGAVLREAVFRSVGVDPSQAEFRKILGVWMAVMG